MTMIDLSRRDLFTIGGALGVTSVVSFVLYCAANSENNAKLYQYRNLHTALFGIGYKFLHSKQMETIRCMQEHGVFTPMHDFDLSISC